MANKVVLVTGGSSGIGLATCKLLQSRGCKVYGTSRKVSLNGELTEGIAMLRLDLNQLPSIRAAVEFILEKEGRLDVLVNNAGVGIAGALEDTSAEEIEDAFRTNVFGVLECCRAVIPQMRKQGGGWIINISSIAGEFGLPFRGVYCATKSALDLFSETLRMELAPAKIRVSYLQPGDIATGINSSRIVAQGSGDKNSPHYERFHKTYREISQEVDAGKDPGTVAAIVWEIINTDNPKMRYPVASFLQRLSLTLNRVLPKHIFQRMLMWKYPVE